MAGAADLLGMGDAHANDTGKGLSDPLTIKGRLLVQVRDPEGNLRDERRVENIITTVGRNMITDRLLASPTLGVPTHMGVGTSGTAAAVGDTTITGETRVALTSKTRGTNVLTLVGDWAAGQATATLQEAGVWDQASTGNLLSRAVFGSIVKGANDTLKVTWTWTIG